MTKKTGSAGARRREKTGDSLMDKVEGIALSGEPKKPGSGGTGSTGVRAPKKPTLTKGGEGTGSTGARIIDRSRMI